MLPSTVNTIRANPEVESVNVYRRANARFIMGRHAALPDELAQAILIAQDTDAVREVNTMKWTDLPGNWREQWQALRDGDYVIVSEPFANRFGASPQNNLITLATDDGPRVFRIRGVFYDYGSDQGVVMMRRDLYRKFWRDEKVSSMALFLKPGVGQVGDSVDVLRRSFAGEGLAITANAELRENALGVFDRTFAITGALNLLAMLVAFIGVLSALMALLIERTREFGIMRATGFTLPQLARLVLTESAYVGATAGLLSIPTGFALAVILIRIINLRAFGWTIELNMQPGTLLQAFVIAVGSALLAAIYPMLRLRNIQIAQAVRQE
jgi:putative ABC transport system permease protein